MLNAWLVVKQLIVTYGLYRAWRMVNFELTYRQVNHGQTWRFHHLNNTGPGAMAYRHSINRALVIVTLLWYISNLDSWRGLRFNRDRGF
tara:strand:+ start:442 stop:708 length:267 start_codon:yes stop_codon:yes gene_type:complete